MLGFHMYCDDYNDWVIDVRQANADWYYVLTPWMEAGAGERKYLWPAVPPWTHCPSDPRKYASAPYDPMVSYTANKSTVIKNYPYGNMSIGSKRGRHKKPSQTIAFFCGQGGVCYWMPESIHDSDKWLRTYRHSGGNNAAYLDGHVAWTVAPYPTDKDSIPWRSDN